MNQVSTVGLDLAKYIFQLHGADSAGAVVFRKKLRRGQLLAFLATLPPCTVALEACGSAHNWGREIAKLGHTVKLISPAYVKPFPTAARARASSRSHELLLPRAGTHLRGRRDRLPAHERGTARRRMRHGPQHHLLAVHRPALSRVLKAGPPRSPLLTAPEIQHTP